MLDVSQWGRQQVPPDQRFCRRCQAPLQTLDGMPLECLTCGLSYSLHDSASFLPNRRFRPGKYWLPAFSAAALMACLSFVSVLLTSGHWQAALFGAVPIPVGVLAGYHGRAPLWLFTILLIVLAGIAVLVLVEGTNLESAWLVGLSASLLTAPTSLGIAVGYVLREILRRTRWDQRWFLR